MPRAGRCLVCGRELGAEPHFALPPDGEHVRCRDWTRHPWPYDDFLVRLRRRYWALRYAIGEVGTLGRWLVERRRVWPAGAAETVLALDARRQQLRRALERVGLRRVG